MTLKICLELSIPVSGTQIIFIRDFPRVPWCRAVDSACVCSAGLFASLPWAFKAAVHLPWVPLKRCAQSCVPVAVIISGNLTMRWEVFVQSPAQPGALLPARVPGLLQRAALRPESQISSRVRAAVNAGWGQQFLSRLLAWGCLWRFIKKLKARKMEIRDLR